MFLENEPINENIIKGFIFNLVGSDRPMHEIIQPNLLEQKHVMNSQFDCISELEFFYSDFEKTRNKLITEINGNMTSNDKEFLLSLKMGDPDWNIYNFKDYPSVQWKLINIQKLKKNNSEKHQHLLAQLKEKLYSPKEKD